MIINATLTAPGHRQSKNPVETRWKKVCSSKRDTAFTSSPPTELVMYDHSKTPSYFPDIWRGNRSLGGGTYSSEVDSRTIWPEIVNLKEHKLTSKFSKNKKTQDWNTTSRMQWTSLDGQIYKHMIMLDGKWETFWFCLMVS